MKSLKETYLTIWTRMFGDILGWSRQETLEWAKKWEESLDDPYDWIYHEDPPSWTISSFVPEALDENLSPDERCTLRNDLLAMFGVRLYLTDYLDVDWKQYKSQIKLILEKYGY